MVQGPSVAALEALRDASASIDEQISILRQLKNEIVGHQQRKELLVKQGAVEPLVRTISHANKKNGTGAESGWSGEDEARLQATLILGSLAAGGSAFMQPLLAANVPECLLSTLESQRSPKQLVATLQALRHLVQQARDDARADIDSPVHVIDRRSLAVFEAILRKRLDPPQWKQLFHLTTDIITAAATTTTDSEKKLFDTGAWSALVYLYTHCLLSRSHGRHGGRGLLPSQEMPQVMSCIWAIIGTTKSRSYVLVHDSELRGLLRQHYPFPQLPQLEVPPIKHVNFNSSSPSFPALASLQAPAGDKSQIPHFSGPSPTGEANHRICMEQISILKRMPACGHLSALRLLATFNKHAVDLQQACAPYTTEAQQLSRRRERCIVMCAVPTAVAMVQTACDMNGFDELPLAEQQAHRELKPEACLALASLIHTSKDLQVAAVESGAIGTICPVLKKTFDNVTYSKPMWSRPTNAGPDDSVPASCKLGSKGMPPELDYAMRCRAAALTAIAAIADKEDIHRQAIVQAGVVACIIDSLKPFPPEAMARLQANGHQVSPKDGNTTTVIIAACAAAQSMSRSVSLLRTSLIDAGIAKPIFDLLKHPDVRVQIAATDVCCNLVLEFSPMREDLLNAGVIKTLTEHARQSEIQLRLSSLWALKHLVQAAPRDIKIQALEDLGVGWLVAAVQGQHRREIPDGSAGGVAINSVGRLSAPNAAGERVDLLNPSSMDVDDPAPASRPLSDEEDGEILYDEASSTHYRASHVRSTLATTSSAALAPLDESEWIHYMREVDENPFWLTQNMDTVVQEQCLDFIRNLLNGEDCAYMLDHLLSQIGTTQVFALLAEKLAPMSNYTSPDQLPTRRSGASGSSSTGRTVYHPTPLILSTIHVLTHISNGSRQQKNLLLAQTPLLQAWLPHFNHHDRRVRVVSVWAVNSLTWVDDDGDRADARERVRMLRSAGIVGAVEGLRGDADLDVRERVRVAVRAFEA